MNGNAMMVRAGNNQEVNGMKFVKAIVLTIAIIGCLNWGLIALFEFDLVAWLFGTMTLLSRIVYGLVGLCGLALILFYPMLSDE